MKKHIYLFMFIMAAVMASCSSDDSSEIDENEPVEPGELIFTASTDNLGGTRTSIDSKKIRWTQGDLISIFNKCSSNDRYQLVEGNGETNGKFKLAEKSGSTSSMSFADNVAVYPYNKDYVISGTPDGYKIENIVVPAEQVYETNNFSKGSMPMVAVSKGTNLSFKNVGGLLKLNLKSVNGTIKLDKIILRGRNDEIIAGKSTVTIGSDGIPSIKMSPDGSKTITLDCGLTELSEKDPTTIYIAVPAINLENGFIVDVYDEYSNKITLKAKSKGIQRNHILLMPEIKYDAYWVDLGLPSGIKWASRNIGANSPKDYGNYYAWGNIEPYSSKPNSSMDGKDAQDISGDITHDVATLKLGGSARMPRHSDFSELYNNDNKCTFSYTTRGDASGLLITGPNGNSIFLPAAGCYDENGILGNQNFIGYYWSSTPTEEDVGGNSKAYALGFMGPTPSDGRHHRNMGQSVRAVSDK